MNDSYNVLFLCTGNSARSMLAEAIMNHRGARQFHRFSVGSHPTGTVNPAAIKLLPSARLSTEGLRSKSWDEFAKPGAPQMDFIFTVCDAAAGESCPLWPGHPITAHWGVPDPAAVRGTPPEIERAFRDAYFTLENLFLSLPHASLDAMEMRAKCAEIGRA
jgi:arsenate reductase (thioredoxin)